MKQTSFKVSEVTPSKTSIPTASPKEAIEFQTNRAVEACSTYQGTLLRTGVHPLFAAAHVAFAQHRPLVLTPDSIWLTIAMGLATHVGKNEKTLRKRFVEHEGKLTLVVRRDDFVRGSLENPWGEVFAAFSAQIAEHIGRETHGQFVSDFSTTGSIERAASEVVLMATVQSYFGFRGITLCGIPEVTLVGEVEDWERLEAKVTYLERFDLEWWTKPLSQVTAECVNAAKGNPSVDFWKSIYKEDGRSGGPYISGWLSWLIPYVERRHYTQGADHEETALVRNKHVGQAGTLTFNDLPSALSAVPFEWHYIGLELNYEFLAGLTGVREHPDSLAVEPVVGWAVRPADAARCRKY